MVLPHGTGDLYHKYRPLRFSEVVGHDQVVKNLRTALNLPQPSQAYLLIGDSGTGKTTSARIAALTLNCAEKNKDGEPCLACAACRSVLSGRCTDVIEVNCADHRGIDAIRAVCSTMPMMPLQLTNKVYILDECFPGETLVMTDYGQAVPIKDVVDNEHITHVLSYDLDKRRIEPRKILKRYKRPYHEKMVRVGFSDGSFVESTRQHKYYVPGRGYVPAEELIVNDCLIEYAGDYKRVSACPHCGAMTDSAPAHLMRHHRDRTNHLAYTQRRRGSRRSLEERKNISDGRRQFYTTDRGKELRADWSQKQRGLGNTIYRHLTIAEVSRRFSEQQKRWWASLPYQEKNRRIQIFINAPKFNGFPNKKETIVSSWGISGLEYTGDGSFFMSLSLADGTTIRKNPDFTYYQNGKITKVVEVMDFEYWHTHEEAQEVVAAYKRAGLNCLIVDASRIGKDNNVRGEIEAFLNNHYRYVTSVEYTNKCRGGTVYDIGVEHNHNFFVVPAKYTRSGGSPSKSAPVLVSNCHQITKDAQSSLLKELEEAPKHVFIILCTTDPQKLLPTVRTRCQQFTFRGLNRKHLSELLRAVATFETYELDDAVYDEIINASGGSPRQALVYLQQVSQLEKPTPEAVGALLLGGQDTSTEVFTLCRELEASHRSWTKIMSLYDGCKEQGAPAVGMMIAGFFRNKLIGAQGPTQAARYARSLSLFINPFPEGKLGENALVLNLYKVHAETD